MACVVIVGGATAFGSSFGAGLDVSTPCCAVTTFKAPVSSHDTISFILVLVLPDSLF